MRKQRPVAMKTFLRALLPAVWAASCGGGTEPSLPVVTSLDLQYSTLTLQVAFSRHLTATPHFAGDAPPNGIPIAWSSDHPEIATVDNGAIDGIAPGVAHVTATAGGRSASATVNVVPTVVAGLALSRDHATLAPGRTLRLVATPLDSLGRSIPGRAVTYVSSDTAVAAVAIDGTITAKGDGTAAINAWSDSVASGALITVVDPTPLVIDVIAVAPAGAVPPAAVAVHMRTADDSLSFAGPADVHGSLAGAMVLADTAQFEARGDSAFMASVLYAPVDALPASIAAVLIPKTLVVPTGSFAGTATVINLPAAVAPCAVATTDQCRPGFGFYPEAFRLGVTAWASLPIPVSISGFTDADTATIWGALRAMEAAVGQPLFTATGMGPGIQVLSGLPPGVSGFSGYTVWSWDARQAITTASVWLPQRPTLPLVQHEFLHALGFSHTCSWASPMGGYGCPSVAMTAQDAAYVRLARAVFTAEAALRLPNGLLPCGAMGVWSVADLPALRVACQGDAWQPPVLLGNPAAMTSRRRTNAMP